MMVGGEVIETVKADGRVWVNCRDRTYPKDACAIYVERNADAEQIAHGDGVWWQGGYAMWTPADRRFTDRKIPRIGFSGVSRPE
jgi:hypothetical protein